MPVVNGKWVADNMARPAGSDNLTSLWFVWSKDGPSFQGKVGGYRFVDGVLPGPLSYKLAERLCIRGRVKRSPWSPDNVAVRWRFLAPGSWDAEFRPAPESALKRIPAPAQEPQVDGETPRGETPPPETPSGGTPPLPEDLEAMSASELRDACKLLMVPADLRSKAKMIAALREAAG